MATRLKNIVRFVAVPPGVPTALPHLLNLDDRSVPPDLVIIGDNDFSGTANATTVTVTNGGAVAANVDVYVEHWHTLEREFGATPASYEGALTPQPFVIGTGSGAGFDQEPILSFIYRPGGVQANNVYTDFVALEAAMAAVQGWKYLEFDDSIVSPIPIPTVGMPVAGWQMNKVIWFGAPRAGVARALVDIPEGCRFQNLRVIDGWISVRNFATATPPVADFLANVNIFRCGAGPTEGNPQIENRGTAPMFDIVAGAGLTFWLRKALFGMPVSISPLVRQAVGTTVTVQYGDASQIGQNVFDTPVGATLAITDARIQVGRAQTALLGTYTKVLSSVPKYVTAPIAPVVPSVASVAVPFPFMVLRHDGAVPHTQTLPLIVGGYTAMGVVTDADGNEVIVKDVTGGGLLTVTPSGADTIDGVAAPKAVPRGGALRLVADGVSNWMTVAVDPNLTIDALGGGAAPTLGTIGGTGPAAAAQNTWIQVSIGGIDYWVPAWR